MTSSPTEWNLEIVEHRARLAVVRNCCGDLGADEVLQTPRLLDDVYAMLDLLGLLPGQTGASGSAVRLYNPDKETKCIPTEPENRLTR